MKKLSNAEGELKKSLAYKKRVIRHYFSNFGLCIVYQVVKVKNFPLNPN